MSFVTGDGSFASRPARVVVWTGLAVVVLFAASILLAPAPELLAAGVAGERLAELYRQHRTPLLAGIYLASLCWGGVFLVFAGALSALLVSLAPQVRMHAWIGLAGAALESAAILLFCALSNAAAFAAGSGEPETVLVLHRAALLANNLSGFPTIVCVGAYTLGARELGLLPSWVVGAGVLCIVAHGLSTASLAATGLFAPAGPASLFAPFTMVLWMLGVSLALRRQRRSPMDASA
jgi:hypothetical protein